MKRSDFLKLLGISALTPSVLIPGKIAGNYKEVPIEKAKFKRWPIYPDRNQWSNYYHRDYSKIEHNAMAYVKVNRDGEDYLIIVREQCIGGTIEDLNRRFEYACQSAQEKYIIENPDLTINGIRLYTKYDPLIHHN